MKKRTKKLIILITVSIMVLSSALPVFAASKSPVYKKVEEKEKKEKNTQNLFKGKCGENVFYEYNQGTKTLTFSGSGDMYEYETFEKLPYATYYDLIKQIVIGDSISGKTWYFNKNFYNK